MLSISRISARRRGHADERSCSGRFGCTGRELHGQLAVATKDHCPLDDIAQLTDVSRPLVEHQRLHAAGRDTLDMTPHGFLEFPDEGSDEQRDILAAIPQGRDGHRKDIQAIVEILAERPLADGLRDRGSWPR